MAEEAGEDAGLLLLRLGRRQGRVVVQGEVDLGLWLLLRGRTAGRLQGHHPDMGLFRLRLLLVHRPAAVLFNEGANGQPQGHHHSDHQQRGKDNDGGHLGKHLDRALRQGTGDGAAGLKGRAGEPELLQSPGGGGEFHLAQHHVAQSAQQHGDQQRADDPQLHRMAVMEQQNKRRQQKRRAGQPVAVAQQAFQQQGEPVDENGPDVEIADAHTQGQHQQDNAPHLPADGALLRFKRLLCAGGTALG